MMAWLEWQHAVISQPRGSAPNSYVAMRQLHADCCICPVEAAEQECGWESQRHGDDRLVEISLVLVLMQRQSCTGSYRLIRQASGTNSLKPALAAAFLASMRKGSGIGGHGSALKVQRVVTI